MTELFAQGTPDLMNRLLIPALHGAITIMATVWLLWLIVRLCQQKRFSMNEIMLAYGFPLTSFVIIAWTNGWWVYSILAIPGFLWITWLFIQDNQKIEFKEKLVGLVMSPLLAITIVAWLNGWIQPLIGFTNQLFLGSTVAY